MTAPTRECKACSGSGCELGRDHYDETGALRVEHCRRPCPACNGTGRQSDVIPARDAMADAETLRVVGREHSWATQHGMLDGTAYYHEPEASADENGAIATYAARAAFRAVPALRGE